MAAYTQAQGHDSFQPRRLSSLAKNGKFLSKHNLDASRSRRGNWHDNAVAESFFPLLKLERIRRRTYGPTLQDAAQCLNGSFVAGSPNVQ